MLDIKVLGTGCASCKNTFALIERTAKDSNIAIQLSKVEAIEDIMQYGVATTPAVVIDGEVVHSGGVPNAKKVSQWLLGETQVDASTCCTEETGSQPCCQPKARKSIFERLGFKKKACC